MHRFMSCVVLFVCCGCSQTASQPPSDQQAQAAAPSGDHIRRELDEVLELIYADRELNLRDHAAWQILHGALTYKRAFLVRTEREGGELVPAVDHILNGGYMNGWTTEPGIMLDKETGQYGLRAIVESGSNTGQGHPDQWFAVLAQCELQPDQPILVDGRRYSMSDFVHQVKWDLPRNTIREFSWTLIGLASYLPTTATWEASDGQQWGIERLMQIELDHDVNGSACGGTHRLIGITMTLNRHVASLQQSPDTELDGVWQRADEVVKNHIAKARQFQNPDGSFSSNYFRRPGNSKDLAQNLGTTGHTLEFLTLAMTDEQLREPWVRRAVENMCDLFRKTRKIPLECGALYHAAHGLALYRERIYGPREYHTADDTAETESNAAASNGAESTATESNNNEP